jgi:hypothetical protein
MSSPFTSEELSNLQAAIRASTGLDVSLRHHCSCSKCNPYNGVYPSCRWPTTTFAVFLREVDDKHPRGIDRPVRWGSSPAARALIDAGCAVVSKNSHVWYTP